MVTQLVTLAPMIAQQLWCRGARFDLRPRVEQSNIIEQALYPFDTQILQVHAGSQPALGGTTMDVQLEGQACLARAARTKASAPSSSRMHRVAKFATAGNTRLALHGPAAYSRRLVGVSRRVVAKKPAAQSAKASSAELVPLGWPAATHPSLH